jgi:Zn-dependent M28 family amino/carboxypeptidase
VAGTSNSRVHAACLGGALGLLSACAGHRGPPPSTDIDETGYRDAVRVLAGDDFEGRRPGTLGEDKTVAYLLAQFRKLGLKPGNGDSYLQPVPLVELEASGEATLSITGRPLQFGKDMVIWTRREAPETVLQHSDLVFLGYGIVAPEYDWNDYAQVDVHGKTVVVMANDPGYGTQDPKVFRGNAQTSYGGWRYKVAEAERQGAAGVLIVHDAGPAGESWSEVVSSHAGPQITRPAPDATQQPAAIEGWLSSAAAQALFARAGADFGALTAAAGHPGFKAVALGVSADAQLHQTVRRFTSSNVVAVLPGANRRREYVMYSAHWDHLGRQPAAAGGAVFNGAVDNASGVAGLLMLAQSLVRTQPPPDRSIAFIAFTGAEAGLLGSSYYVENPVFPFRETVAVLNLDQLHIGGPTRDVMVFGFGNSELDEYVREAAQLQGREMRPDAVPERGLYYGSDQYSFAKAGIPALYAQGGFDDSARGPTFGRAQFEDYLAHRHGQTSDKYTADWDVRGALDDLRLYYEVGYRLARSRRFPRWYPTSEFRASRPVHGRESPTE